jgi:hypothetical protein
MVILLGIGLMAACFLVHYETLRFLNDHGTKLRFVSSRNKILLNLIGASMSHLTQIFIFALAYWLLKDDFSMGGFGGTFRDTLWTFLYFSSETYTTLGFGDIYPTGALRYICGIEALMGLLMISWTASFTYLEMRRYW